MYRRTMRRASRASGHPLLHSDAEDDEEMAALGNVPLVGTFMASIELHENIYSFVILFPTLHRHKHGHSCTPPAIIAFLLFALNVFLQLGLTTIAGGYILQQDRLFRNEVLPIEMQPNLLYSLSEPWAAIGGSALASSMATKPDFRAFQAEAERHLNLSKNVGSCCVGADCSYIGVHCCPSGVKPIEHDDDDIIQLLTERSNLRKPSGRSGAGTKGRLDDDDSKSIFRSNGPLCHMEAGMLVCTQPTFDFVSEWSELDINGDGVWTLQEAKDDVANLGCRLGLPTIEVFRSVCRGVQMDIMDTGERGGSLGERLRAPEEILDCTSVQRQYFEYWKGLAAICATPGRDQCGELILRGTFDGLLLFGKSGMPRGGVVDLNSALAYCQRILTPGGVCETMLPVTYTMHMHRLREKCGPAKYEANHPYENPADKNDVIGLVSISYANVRQYTSARELTFNIFVGCILFVWYLTLITEIKAVMWLADFSWNFPGPDEPAVSLKEAIESVFGTFAHVAERTGWHRENTPRPHSVAESAAEAEAETDDPHHDAYEHDADESADNESVAESSVGESPSVAGSPSVIGSQSEGRLWAPPLRSRPRLQVSWKEPFSPSSMKINLENITREMRVMCFAVVCVRFWLTWYMGIVGTIFTLSTYSFDELLMNAVALAFIFELPELLFMLLVSSREKKELDLIGPLKYRSRLAQLSRMQRFFFSRYFWGLVIIPIFCYVVVRNNYANVVVPMHEALSCACMQSGPRCLAAHQINPQWWAQYWSLYAEWPQEVISLLTKRA